MFSIRLRNLRGKKYTQQDIADYLGITRQAYGKYEAGQSEPDINTLNKLAGLFEVSIDYLLGRTDKPTYENNPINVSFRDGGENISEEESEYLEQQLKYFRELRKKFHQEKN